MEVIFYKISSGCAIVRTMLNFWQADLIYVTTIEWEVNYLHLNRAMIDICYARGGQRTPNPQPPASATSARFTIFQQRRDVCKLRIRRPPRHPRPDSTAAYETDRCATTSTPITPNKCNKPQKLAPKSNKQNYTHIQGRPFDISTTRTNHNARTLWRHTEINMASSHEMIS